MTFRNLDKEWDEVLIIDLLSDSERKNHRISEATGHSLATNGIPQLQMNCSLKRHVFEALNLALSRTQQNSFVIHFTAHGCKRGIGNNEGLDLVTWGELRQPLAKINAAFNGDLIVNMIACEGIHGLKIDDLMDPAAPFYALIGPTCKLGYSEARKVCLKFYTKLLTTTQIPLVVKEINAEANKRILWARSSQSMRNETISLKGA